MDDYIIYSQHNLIVLHLHELLLLLGTHLHLVRRLELLKLFQVDRARLLLGELFAVKRWKNPHLHFLVGIHCKLCWVDLSVHNLTDIGFFTGIFH